MLIKIENGKTNFIDCNDNYVGYDDQYTSCCEHPYWEFEDTFGNPLGENVDPLLPMSFTGETKPFDDGVEFPCNNGYSLKLYNIQNGYYSHLWESHFDGVDADGFI